MVSLDRWSAGAELLAATLAGALPWLDDPTQTTVHLDAGYDQQPVRSQLADRQVGSVIAPKGERAPVQASARWVVERTQGWMNGFVRLRRCPERCRAVVAFHLFLAATFVVVRQVIERARNRYRWATRPTTRRLK